MSNAFTNFLGGVVSGVFGPSADLRDYQHANRLYAKDTFARAPKVGFLYYIVLNLNPAAIANTPMADKQRVKEVGLLVKKLDMPKFEIETETVNQYNRKTLIQKAIKYTPISIELHDDNSDITHNLWTSYYKFQFHDSNYGTSGRPAAYYNTKNGIDSYKYGLKNNRDTTTYPFFDTIDIYVLHQHKFTQMTLVNPVITNWAHDSLDQDIGNKVLSNKMTIAYEAVLYNNGKIAKNNQSGGFTALYYDKTPSPLSVAGNGNNSIFGANGVLAGADSVFGAIGEGNYVGAAIQAATLTRNIKNISLASIKQEGYSIAGSTLRDIQISGNQPRTIQNSINAGIQSGNGVNIFSNSASNATTTAKAYTPGSP